jgi:DNA-binding NarL/FixJ family response regulator
VNKELIRVLIVDDHSVVREGLKHLFSRQIDMLVAGEAASCAEALDLLTEERFDVVVCDVKLPDGLGWEVLKAVKSGKHPVPVLILSAFTEEQYAVQALKSGADGYVNKGSAAETLITAVRRLASGGKFVSPEFAAHVAQGLGHGDSAAHEALSEREFAVLRMIASGSSLVAIAQSLNISPKTVTTYRARVLEKLSLENNAALTRYVLEKGLLD